MRSDSTDLRNQFKHERAAADHPVKLEILKKLIFQLQAALPVFRILFNLIDFPSEPLGSKWLGKIVGGAFLNRFHRGFGRVKARHQNDVDARIEFQDLLQHLHPLDTWHDQIEKDDLRARSADKLQTALCVRRVMNFKALVRQNKSREFDVRGIVVDDYEYHVRIV